MSLRAGTSGAVASFDYAFDAIGNLTTRTDHNENYTEGFCYDSVNRLTNYALDATGGRHLGRVELGRHALGRILRQAYGIELGFGGLGRLSVGRDELQRHPLQDDGL